MQVLLQGPVLSVSVMGNARNPLSKSPGRCHCQFPVFVDKYETYDASSWSAEGKCCAAVAELFVLLKQSFDRSLNCLNGGGAAVTVV